jgi:hypothetical protein
MQRGSVLDQPGRNIVVREALEEFGRQERARGFLDRLVKRWQVCSPPSHRREPLIEHAFGMAKCDQKPVQRGSTWAATDFTPIGCLDDQESFRGHEGDVCWCRMCTH